jgi:hypothetical protein
VIPAVLICLDPYITNSLSTEAVFGILLGKRVLLYAMAVAALDFASRRSSIDYISDFGERFIKVNEDILGVSYTAQVNEAAQESGLSQTFGHVKESAQAISLPFLAAAALGVSYLSTTFFQSTVTSSATAGIDFERIITQVLHLVASLPFAAIGYLFTNAELKPVLKDGTVAAIASLCLVAAAYLLPLAYAWPFQNLVNVAILCVVSRLLSFSQVGTVLIAVLGLTIYDVISVLGAVQAADSGSSIMETVAKSRLGGVGSQWQPGLLSVVIKGRVTDALGLGDVIFPSILSGWALRQNNNSTESSPTMYKTCIVGYMIGCILCELTMSGGGLPALLYLVPAMLIGLALLNIKQSVGRAVSK